ncbi:hypothetical protein CHS0354_038946 [Potamilus streckersoni]|uniref:Uncharacterized protein n=1 Tax=Potamilus streckersoni TaxID=2493646 RepID=A0AAE0VNL7_9BIVA|nr:hypothetical protein CHS0354_038946 [Potamilus streckersoni]
MIFNCTIRLDLISGWVLGLGPCGLNCSRASINSDTNLTRKKVMQIQNDPYYFGNWTVAYKLNGDRNVQVDYINDKIYNNMVQKVIDVSEKGNWEQDWMSVPIPMISGATFMDIM